MSDLIRQMLMQNRGPIGLGNNPSPFQVPYPNDVPQEPAMPADAMRKEMQSVIMDMDNRQHGSEMEKLKSYYEKHRNPPQQRGMPTLGGSAWTMGY